MKYLNLRGTYLGDVTAGDTTIRETSPTAMDDVEARAG